MMRAGWMRRWASRTATRRISWSDQRMRPGELEQRFWGRRLVGMLADHGQHGEGEHRQRDVPVPDAPAAGLVVIEPELVLGGLEAVLDRPAASLGLDQRRYLGPGRAPGREEGELAAGGGTADQEAPCPKAGEAVPVLGGLEVGQLEVGPVVEPRPLGPVAGRKPRPRRCG